LLEGYSLINSKGLCATMMPLVHANPHLARIAEFKEIEARSAMALPDKMGALDGGGLVSDVMRSTTSQQLPSIEY
jgi:hypothetical protein